MFKVSSPDINISGRSHLLSPDDLGTRIQTKYRSPVRNIRRREISRNRPDPIESSGTDSDEVFDLNTQSDQGSRSENNETRGFDKTDSGRLIYNTNSVEHKSNIDNSDHKYSIHQEVLNNNTNDTKEIEKKSDLKERDRITPISEAEGLEISRTSSTLEQFRSAFTPNNSSSSSTAQIVGDINGSDFNTTWQGSVHQDTSSQGKNISSGNILRLLLGETLKEDSTVLDSNQEDSRVLKPNQEDSRISESNQEESRVLESNPEDSRISESNQEDSRVFESNQEDSRISESNQEDSRDFESNQEDSRISESNQEDSRVWEQERNARQKISGMF